MGNSPTIPFWKVGQSGTPKIPWITQNPALWNTVTLGGVQWQGDAWVTGKSGNRIDKKHIPGIDRATLTSLGIDCARINIELIITTVNDWANLQNLMPILKPRKGNRPQPIDAYHPLLALLGIRSLLMARVPIPKRSGGNDLLAMEIEFIEYSPQKSGKVVTASGSIQSIPHAIAVGQTNPPGNLVQLPSTDPNVTGPQFFNPTGGASGSY